MMSTGQILFLLGAVLSFGAMTVIIFRLDRREAPAESIAFTPTTSLSEILATGIIMVATDLILIFKRTITAIYFFLLLFGHRSASTANKILHQVENRFSGLIATAHGRNRHAMIKGRRGAVSFFLEQLKIDKRH